MLGVVLRATEAFWHYVFQVFRVSSAPARNVVSRELYGKTYIIPKLREQTRCARLHRRGGWRMTGSAFARYERRGTLFRGNSVEKLISYRNCASKRGVRQRTGAEAGG